MKRARPFPADALPSCVLTLQVARPAADAVAGRIRRAWGIEPVQVERPGAASAWVEAFFKTELEAALAARVLGRERSVQGVALRGYSGRDWVSHVRRQFRARNVGRRLRIVPAWERGAAPRGRVAIVINPGLSFGTGDHFTTRFCLEAVEELAGRGRLGSFLDLGTGSAILAVAAAKLGARRVLGVDCDPQAIAQARENVALNRLARRVRLKVLDITAGAPAGTYDVVCANLYGPVLVEAAPAIRRGVRGRLVVSGVREAEADGVAEAYRALGGRETVRDGDGEWCGLVFEFPERRVLTNGCARVR